MKKLKLILGSFVLLFSSSCGILENVVESPAVVDAVGLDFSACVGNADVCLEFFLDNDELLFGQNLDWAFFIGLLENYSNDNSRSQ